MERRDKMHLDYRRVIARNRRRQIFKKIVGILCCIVVFCTTYALILPAITMENKALCGVEEHTHTEGCYEKSSGLRQICGQQEQEGHAHGESCYMPGETEAPTVHSHNSNCYCQGALICETEADHIHAAECFTEQTICEAADEAHIHDDACVERVLNCAVEEYHSHSASCYEWTVSCGMEEGQPEAAEPAEPVLVCTEPEVEAHTHDDTCFEEMRSGFVTVCGNTAEDHSHSSDCYKLECVLPEHEHTMICFSDPEADVETPGVWEATFADVTLTGNSADDLVAIAQSQIGYTESSRNYHVRDDNTLQGYTRYGAWFGDPYGQWDAMFISFCLRYAGVEGMPGGDSVSSLQSGLISAGLYCSAKETKAQKGNLIFLDTDADGISDRVGIVAQVQEAQEHTGDSVKTIEGDVSGSVRYQYYTPDASQILGYGLLPGQERIPVGEDSIPDAEIESNTDISLGPVVTITAQKQETEEQMPQSGRRMRFASARTGEQSLTSYLQGKGDTYFFSLTLADGTTPVPKDEVTQNYIVNAGTQYKLTLTVDALKGMAPGTYYYNLPSGMSVIGGQGDLKLDSGEVLGKWEITSDGTMLFTFYDNADTHTHVYISAGMSVTFSESDTPLDFDGKITVTINPPEQIKQGTVLSKWGSPAGSSDRAAINWKIKIEGRSDSNIPGSVIVDTLASGSHSYTEADMQQGLKISAEYRDSDTMEEAEYHSWMVYPGDLGLTWTSSEWSYTMPETAMCMYCGPLKLGNENWTYYVDYTSTPNLSNGSDVSLLANHVSADDKEFDASTIYSTGAVPAGIVKDGVFTGDHEGGKFKWTVHLSIPGTNTTGEPTWGWFIADKLKIYEGTSEVGQVYNDISTKNNVSVLMKYPDGNTVAVPHITQSDGTAPVVWYSGNSDPHDRNIQLFCRCVCTEDYCHHWYGTACGWQPWVELEDGSWHQFMNYCPCWTIQEDVQIIFTYETSMTDRINEKYTYGANTIRNIAQLFRSRLDETGTQVPTPITHGQGLKELPIPALFKKMLNHAYDGYTAAYTITVNEGKVALTDGSPLTIHDVMTDTLAYAKGSMVITVEDVNGATSTLKYLDDYTLTYDGSGTQTDNQGNPAHVLDIVILEPKPVMYTLSYDAALVLPETITGAVKYSNYATVSIWGKGITADSAEKELTDFNFSTKSYRLYIAKKASGTDQVLSGAEFGLYTAQGIELDRKTTDLSGKILFQTSVSKDIILTEHQPFYVQEISAPEGYILDDTKHWFYFCDSGDGCHKGDPLKDEYDNIVRLPGGLDNEIAISNVKAGYELPATGGTGKELYTVGGMLLMMAAAVLLYNQKKCRKEDYEAF